MGWPITSNWIVSALAPFSWIQCWEGTVVNVSATRARFILAWSTIDFTDTHVLGCATILVVVGLRPKRRNVVRGPLCGSTVVTGELGDFSVVRRLRDLKCRCCVVRGWGVGGGCLGGGGVKLAGVDFLTLVRCFRFSGAGNGVLGF